jgi:spore coat polysaccharide biosynthesis protein SpsF
MGSSRLPGKVLLESCGKPLLQHMIERLKRCSRADDVVVATTIEKQDDQIIELCEKLSCSFHRGSEEDVLDRLIETGRAHHAEIMVQTTGDCPLIDPQIVDEVINLFINSTVDYVSNRLIPSFPMGLDVQVYKHSILERVAELTQDPNDREHGSYYIYTHPELFTMKNYSSDRWNCPEKRWALDYPEDYQFINSIYNRLYPKTPDFDTSDILSLLEQEPELENLNSCHEVHVVNYPFRETL